MNTYGLIGYPLGHSFSQRFFTQKFEEEHIEAQYLNFELEDLTTIKEVLKDKTIKGLNVTIPYKKNIFAYLDEVSDEVKAIGAVNVIKLIRENNQLKLVGYNSDIFGFKESIRPLLKPFHQKALVLGTGGASNAIKVGLSQLGITTQSVSRTKQDDTITYNEITKEVLAEYNVIINCTPLGTYPNIEGAPDIPYQHLSTQHLLYDLVYNPAETSFLRQGRVQGATTKNGLEMLYLQAIKAWEIWQ